MLLFNSATWNIKHPITKYFSPEDGNGWKASCTFDPRWRSTSPRDPNLSNFRERESSLNHRSWRAIVLSITLWLLSNNQRATDPDKRTAVSLWPLGGAWGQNNWQACDLKKFYQTINELLYSSNDDCMVNYIIKFCIVKTRYDTWYLVIHIVLTCKRFWCGLRFKSYNNYYYY